MNDTTTKEKPKVHPSAKEETKDQPATKITPETLTQGGAVVATEGYGEDAGAGFENLTMDEQLIPFMRILQSNSPQVDPAHGSYIPGAVQGMLINTATGQLYDGKIGVGVVPVSRDHNYVEFVPRDDGGGFVSIWDVADPRLPDLRKAQGQFGKLKLESGNELNESYYFYVVYVSPDGETQRALLAFSSTQIKKYKMTTTRLSGLIGDPPTAPLFAWRWRLTTVPEQNKKGKFYGYRLALDAPMAAEAQLWPKDPLFQTARAFSKLIREGKVRADYANAVPATAENEDEIPF